MSIIRRRTITLPTRSGTSAVNTTTTMRVVAAVTVTHDHGYTACRMSANATSALSQAHKENRVPASEPGGAIFMCGDRLAVQS